MQFNTRFGIGDEVWTLQGRSLTSFKVYAVRAETDMAVQSRPPRISYCERVEGPLRGGKDRYVWYSEGSVFTHEEAVNILMEMD